MGRHEEALKILHGGTVIPAIPLAVSYTHLDVYKRQAHKAALRTKPDISSR